MLYKTEQGDTWDLIAHKVYGNDKMCAEILRANQKYNRIVIFSSGITLNCPDITEAETVVNLPPWKRGNV